MFVTIIFFSFDCSFFSVELFYLPTNSLINVLSILDFVPVKYSFYMPTNHSFFFVWRGNYCIFPIFIEPCSFIFYVFHNLMLTIEFMNKFIHFSCYSTKSSFKSNLHTSLTQQRKVNLIMCKYCRINTFLGFRFFRSVNHDFIRSRFPKIMVFFIRGLVLKRGKYS